ncbi:MAG: hypothetical protein Q9159_002971 [Coniocarpon cinnabarinum]
MAFGKLYGYEDNTRTIGLLAVAKENKLDIELVHTAPLEGVTDDYRKLNKLGRIPTFEGSDGFVLSEVIAIAVYCESSHKGDEPANVLHAIAVMSFILKISYPWQNHFGDFLNTLSKHCRYLQATAQNADVTSQNEKTSLLGKTKQDYASILRWLSFANSEVLPKTGGYFAPLVGRAAYNKKSVDDSLTALNAAAKVMEDHLMINTYLVSERLTLADIMAAALCVRAFQFVWDKQWRSQHPSITRWFETIIHQPIMQAVRKDWVMCDQALKNQPPAKPKEEKPKQEKPKQAKKEKPETASEAVDEEEEPKEAPKPKHPLEALGRPTLAIDEWKRKYKNEETREVALPWFWENMNFEEYSIWAVDFQYNEELTMTFMSSNQVGGFFARLEASRKYLMGCCSVYGVTNDSVIKGAFLVRGQEALPAFDVAPDYESYKFKKLDPKSSQDREFVDDMWAWDKPVEVNGKKYEWADGKIFV